MKNQIKSAAKPILSRIKRFKNIHKGESCYLFGDGIVEGYYFVWVWVLNVEFGISIIEFE